MSWRAAAGRLLDALSPFVRIGPVQVLLSIVHTLLGSLVIACGAGLAWTLYAPAQPATQFFLGGLLMPPAFVAAFLWLWLSRGNDQRWRRLLVTAVPLWLAVGWMLGIA